MYRQLPLRQWGAGSVYLLVLSSWKVNIAKTPIAVGRKGILKYFGFWDFLALDYAIVPN